jgi:hypothetical protein
VKLVLAFILTVLVVSFIAGIMFPDLQRPYGNTLPIIWKINK